MSAWTCRSSDGKAVVKIVPPRLRIPLWKGPGADSEEKHEPASDIDTVAVDSLKALDLERPIREAAIKLSPSRRRNHLKAFAIARPAQAARVVQVQSPDSGEVRELRPPPPDGSGPQYSQ